MQQSPPQGWYPDPSNRRNQRFWDGDRWTGQVRAVPGAPLRRPRWLVPVVALGVALMVIGGGLFALGLNRETAAPSPASSPSEIVAPSAESVPGDESVRPPAPITDPAICAVGDPTFRNSESGDGRLHGGGLAMPGPAGWTPGPPDRVGWAFDVGLSEAPGAAGWAALGAVRIEDPYSTPQQASATIAGCLRAFADPDTLRVTGSGPATVPGAERAYAYSGTLRVGGDDRSFRVVVADLHSPESLACYVRIVDPDSDQQRAVGTAEERLTAA